MLHEIDTVQALLTSQDGKMFYKKNNTESITYNNSNESKNTISINAANNTVYSSFFDE